VSLWSDISRLNKSEFTAVLDQLVAPPQPSTVRVKRPRKPPRPLPKDDRPVTRIAFVLQVERNLTDRDAQLRLSQILIERGYPASSIPRAGDDGLEAWLTKLLRNVPSADVMDAARNL
jgi:hypothetical protein